MMEKGEAQAALESANPAVGLAPRHAKAWLTKGMLHYELEEYPAAKDAFERNLTLAPNGRNADTLRVLLESL